MSYYARGSKTSVSLTQKEILRTAKRYRATDIHFAEGLDLLSTSFKAGTARILVTVPMPTPIALPATVRGMHDYEQRRREAWRVLALIVKTHLVCESVGASARGTT